MLGLPWHYKARAHSLPRRLDEPQPLDRSGKLGDGSFIPFVSSMVVLTLLGSLTLLTPLPSRGPLRSFPGCSGPRAATPCNRTSAQAARALLGIRLSQFPQSFFPRFFLHSHFFPSCWCFSQTPCSSSRPDALFSKPLPLSVPAILLTSLLDLFPFLYSVSIFCHHHLSFPPLLPVCLSPVSLSFLPRRPGVSLGP